MILRLFCQFVFGRAGCSFDVMFLTARFKRRAIIMVNPIDELRSSLHDCGFEPRDLADTGCAL